MRLTLVQRQSAAGKRNVRSWHVEPLPQAILVGLALHYIVIGFYDGRMEPIT